MNAPVNDRDLIGQSKKLFDDARALLNKTPEEITVEDVESAKKMMADGKKFQAQAQAIKDIEAVRGELELKANQQDTATPPPDAPQFKNFSEFLFKCWQWAAEGKRDPRLKAFREIGADAAKPEERKDMAESVGSTGGFLVPPDNLTSMMSVSGETALIRPLATKIRMARRQINIPVLDQTSTTSGRPHWFGGLRVYWAAEAQAKTESDAAFREMTLVAHKMIMYTRASDELVDDAAISLNDFLSGPLGFPGAIAWEEDWAFLNGNGAGQPLGVIPAPATLTVARALQGDVTYADLVTMLESMYPGASPIWIAHQTLMSNLLLMNGPTGNPVYLWGSARDGVPSTLLGYPIRFSEKPPARSTTSVGDLGLYDFKYYVIGDRQATTVESTKFDRWSYDQTSWRAVHRVDGQPWLSSPITYWDGGTQVSPFVILGAKST